MLQQRFGQGARPGIRRAVRQNRRHHDREDRRSARVQPDRIITILERPDRDIESIDIPIKRLI